MNYKAKTHFKAVFSFLAAFFLVLNLSGQVMVKGTGIRYYQGYTLATYATATAPETTYGTEVAFFIDLNILCKWDRVNSIWVPTDNVLSQSGVPVHTPNVGDPINYLDKSSGDLYKWGGASWSLIGSGAASVVVSRITNVKDTTILSPTTGDEWVNVAGDTSGVYSSDRWLIRSGGGGGNWDHIASQEIDLDTFWISPDGTSKGIQLPSSGGYIYESLVNATYREQTLLSSVTLTKGIIDDSFLSTQISFIKDATNPRLDFAFNGISNWRIFKDHLGVIPPTSDPVDITFGDSYFYLYPIRSGAAGTGDLRYKDGTSGTEKTLVPRSELQDSSIAIRADFPSGGGGSQDLSSVLTQGNDAGAAKITNLASPTDAGDAVNLGYFNANSGAAANFAVAQSGVVPLPYDKSTQTHSSNLGAGQMWGEYDIYINDNTRKFYSLIIDAAAIDDIIVSFVYLYDADSILVLERDTVTTQIGLNTFYSNSFDEEFIDFSLYPNVHITLSLTTSGSVKYRTISPKTPGFSTSSRTSVTYTANRVLEFDFWQETFAYKRNASVLPDLSNLPEVIEWGEEIYIPPGTYTVNDPIVISESGKRIYGVPGQTIIELAPGVDNIFDITTAGVKDLEIYGLTLRGNGSTIDINSSAILGNLDSIYNLRGAGTEVGIKIGGVTGPAFVERINIHDCVFEDFTYTGIQIIATGEEWANGVKISDSYALNCYAGVVFEGTAEYSALENFSGNGCLIGAVVFSKNLLFDNCHFNGNRVGFFYGSDTGVNPGHSGVSNSTFNHNAMYAIVTENVTSGFTLSGSFIWSSGPVYIYNTSGFLMSNISFSSAVISLEGGGRNMISDSFFANTPTINEDQNSTTTDIQLKNNHYMDGSSNTAINN